MKGFSSSRLMKRAALPAAGLFAGLTMVGWSLAPGALANTPNRLQLFITNQAGFTIYRTDKGLIEQAPTSIAPKTTGEVKVNSGDQVTAQITFADNADVSKSTCSVQIQITYSFNSTTQRCDSKWFGFVATGQCKIQQQGACYGANSCKCNFTFSKGGLS